MICTTSPSILEINLDAVAENYRFIKEKLKKDTLCAAVVKANAYGLGAVEVSRALYAQDCHHFFVATFEEGLEAREALSFSLPPSSRPSPAHAQERAGGEGEEGRAAIYVLHGANGASLEDFLQHNLIPVLNTRDDIQIWADFAKRTEQKQPAILHIDTGMNRLGLSAQDLSLLNTDILRPLDIRYVMSHLACSDDPDHPKNSEQLDLFKILSAKTGLSSRLSLANSGGIFLGEEYHFDLVRPGCALYGLNPQSNAPNPMQNVITLKARILQVRRVDRAGSVGYGASCAVSSGTLCAVIAAGYADGLFRSLGGRGRVVINGEKCPILGRVSMDSIVVDVTGLKIEPQVGDWAEILGSHQTADDVAAQAGTIGYEILTALGKRYKRIYR